MPEPRPLVAIERLSGSVSEICRSGDASISFSIAARRCISLSSLTSFSFRWLLQVGRVELREITRHALLQLCAAPFHFPAREVLVAGVDGFELTPIDRNARCREQAHLAAQFDKLHADLLDRRPTILAEVGNRLVIGNEPARQPHHLNVAPSFTLKPPTRLNATEVAVNVELQQPRGMI